MFSFLFGILLTITGVLGPFLVEPALGLAVFSAFTHITPDQLSIIQFRAPFIVAIATLLGYLISKDYPRKFNKFPLEMKLYAVILIGMYLGARNAYVSRLAFEHFTIYFKYGVFLLLMVNILDSLKRIELFNDFLILGAAWLVYKCWDLRGTTGARFENIGGGTVGDSNQYAAALIILLPLVFMRVFRTSSPVYIRVGALLGVFGMIMAILISVSRGAFLGLSVSVVCFLILFQQYRKYTIICALLLALAVSPFVPEHYYSRIDTIFSSEDQSRDYSAQSRLVFWGTAIGVWKQHPVYG
nr:O-antigen ligase family protein [Spirochaetales bacterium]